MRSPSRSTGVRTFASTRSEQFAIELAAANQMYRGDAHPFLIDLSASGIDPGLMPPTSE